MRKRFFYNQEERAFYDFMLAKEYKEPTVWHYIQRLRIIDSVDSLVNKNINSYIASYKTGAKRDVDSKNHRAYSIALKHLRQYMLENNLTAA